MKLVVGLGNPGKKFEQTRHNIGWRTLDALGVQCHPEAKFTARVTQCGDVVYCQPMTFMNHSGKAVRAVADYYKIKPRDVIVLHDDIDLPFGMVRLRSGGSAGGHNGVQSIIDHLGTEAFPRIRIGIKPDHDVPDTARFVLKKFSRSERKRLDALMELALNGMTRILEHGIDKKTHQDLAL